MNKFYNTCSQINQLLGFEYVPNLSKSFYIADFITGEKYPFENDDIDPFEECNSVYDWYIVNFASEGDVRIKGYGHYPAFEKIHYYAKLHKIPASKIILFSSNLAEEASYDKFCQTNAIKEPIKIFVWSPLMYRLLAYEHNVNPVSYNKLFLCLNNGVKKFHRSYLTELLYTFKLHTRTHLSTYKIPLQHLKQSRLSKDNIRSLKKMKNTFFDSNGNSVFSCPADQVQSSCSSIVNETHHQSYDNNMIDITEKVFKPMLWKHPLIIFGAKGVNKNIKLLGFKTYEPFFDLSFDETEYWMDRYKQGVESLSELSSKLEAESQICKWLEQGQDILNHNQQLILNNTYNKSVLEKFLKFINGGKGGI